jgi:hypothetical protein
MKGRLASATDFAKDHWEEPLSDNGELLLLRSPLGISGTQRARTSTKDPRRAPTAPTSSLMMVDPPPLKGTSQVVVPPASSPISQNPLLAKKVARPPLVPQIPNVQSNIHWLNSHGLVPVGESINAPGYVSGGEHIATVLYSMQFCPYEDPSRHRSHRCG